MRIFFCVSLLCLVIFNIDIAWTSTGPIEASVKCNNPQCTCGQNCPCGVQCGCGPAENVELADGHNSG